MWVHQSDQEKRRSAHESRISDARIGFIGTFVAIVIKEKLGILGSPSREWSDVLVKIPVYFAIALVVAVITYIGGIWYKNPWRKPHPTSGCLKCGSTTLTTIKKLCDCGGELVDTRHLKWKA